MDNSLSEKASRVKKARSLTSLSRREFCRRYEIPENTLREWENPKKSRNGITDKGAKRLISALINEGVECTFDWILNGDGQGPAIIRTPASIVSIETWNQEESIICEMSTFKSQNPGAVVTVLTSDDFKPIYLKGDILGAIVGTDFNPFQLSGKICIFQKHSTSKPLIRKYFFDRNQKTHVLTVLDPTSPTEQTIVEYDNPCVIGEVIWMRRKLGS